MKGWRGQEPREGTGAALRQERRDPGWVMSWVRLGIAWMWGREAGAERRRAGARVRVDGTCGLPGLPLRAGAHLAPREGGG